MPFKRKARDSFTYQHEPQTPAVRRKTVKEILDAGMFLLAGNSIWFLNKINKWHTGILEHHPLPSPPRDDGYLAENSEPAVSPDRNEEQTQEAVPVPEPDHWYSRIQKRLGSDSSGVLPPPAMGPPSSPRYPSSPSPRSSGDSLATATLANISQQTSAIADSVNVIDHQFKLSILGRVGSLEKEVSLIKEMCERSRDCLKGIEGKLQWRKGVPCDMLDRLDSMTAFTYAFCKGMEDAGIFQMRKK